MNKQLFLLALILFTVKTIFSEEVVDLSQYKSKGDENYIITENYYYSIHDDWVFLRYNNGINIVQKGTYYEGYFNLINNFKGNIPDKALEFSNRLGIKNAEIKKAKIDKKEMYIARGVSGQDGWEFIGLLGISGNNLYFYYYFTEPGKMKDEFFYKYFANFNFNAEKVEERHIKNKFSFKDEKGVWKFYSDSLPEKSANGFYVNGIINNGEVFVGVFECSSKDFKIEEFARVGTDMSIMSTDSSAVFTLFDDTIINAKGKSVLLMDYSNVKKNIPISFYSGYYLYFEYNSKNYCIFIKGENIEDKAKSKNNEVQFIPEILDLIKTNIYFVR